MLSKNNELRSDLIRQYIDEMDLYVIDEIKEEELFIVDASDYGIHNLIIDIEDEYVIFFMRLGEFKEELCTVDTLKALLTMNNPISGYLSTGQFGLDVENENLLVFGEQHLFKTFDFDEFEDTIIGFSNNLIQNFEIIKTILKDN